MFHIFKPAKATQLNVDRAQIDENRRPADGHEIWLRRPGGALNARHLRQQIFRPFC